MNLWNIIKKKDIPKLSNPILLEGLPGIGNVGKVAVDFLIEEMGAKKLCDLTSHSFPHSVFVNEDNLVELPSVSLYYKKRRGKDDIVFLAGDVQPIDETSCYDFCEKVLEVFEKLGGKTVITLGGIGLKEIPEKPKIYISGCKKAEVKSFLKDTKATDKLYGTVGPIVGVTGILLGLSGKRRLKAITLLAETFGHPMYLGIKGAKEMLMVLEKKLGLSLSYKRMDKEIKFIEQEIRKRASELHDVLEVPSMQDIQEGKKSDKSYIG